LRGVGVGREYAIFSSRNLRSQADNGRTISGNSRVSDSGRPTAADTTRKAPLPTCSLGCPPGSTPRLATLTPSNWLKARQAAAKAKVARLHRGRSARNYHRYAPAPPVESHGAAAQGLEDGRLGRRVSSLPESHPHFQPPPPFQLPYPTQPDATGRERGGAFPRCRQPQRMPPSAAGAPRQGERAGDL
jgi:hypothetical protein